MAKKAYVWDGTSWISISSTIPEVNTILPSQTGNSGRFLTTNGSSVSWGTVDLSPYATKASPTFTGTVTVPTPINLTDAATKGYVDNNAISLQPFFFIGV